MSNEGPHPDGDAASPNYRMWVLPCPFKRSGFPVLGTFGSTERNVVIMTIETWQRLCAAVPQLKTTEFEVGIYDEV